MYKELVISIIIIISIFALDYITQKYTDFAINEAISNLHAIKQSLKEENVDNKKAVKDAEEKYERWMEHHKKLAFYDIPSIFHTSLLHLLQLFCCLHFLLLIIL